MGLPTGAERARNPLRRAGSGPLRLKAKKDEKQPKNGYFRVFEPVFAEKCRFWAILGHFFRDFARFSSQRRRTARRRRKRARSRAFACGASRLPVNLSC